MASNEQLWKLAERSGIRPIQILRTISEEDPDVSILATVSHWRKLSSPGQKLTDVPTGIIFCQNLSHLVLQENLLKEIPECLCSLSSLKSLALARNQISEIPINIKKLKELEDFILADNKIIDMTPLCQCTKLKYLLLNGNQIECIPPLIKNLRGLRQFYIGANNLCKIPDEICLLKKLDTLFVQKNRLTHLPLYLDHCVSMKEREVGGYRGLYLANNPLLRPLSDIYQLGTKVVFQYLKDLRCGVLQTEHQQVIVVGETGVGKTSVTKSMIENASFLVDADNRTRVLDRYTWKPENNLQIQISDFGGHHIYKLANNFFLNSTAVILLVFNFSEYSPPLYQTLVGSWLSLLMSRANGASLLLVGTHSDLCTSSDITEKMADVSTKVSIQQQQMIDFINHHIQIIKDKIVLYEETAAAETSAVLKSLEKSYGERLEHLRNLQENQLKVDNHTYAVSCTSSLYGIPKLQKDLIGLCKKRSCALPESWLSVQDIISEEKTKSQPYLSYDKFCEIVCRGMSNIECEINSITVKQETASALLRYLHHSGQVIWYNNDDNLKKRIFHQPEIIVDVLKTIFHHNMESVLQHDNLDFGFTSAFSKQKFEMLKSDFLVHGNVSVKLLQCLMKQLSFCEEDFLTMVHLLKKFGLCYEIPCSSLPETNINSYISLSSLHFPWFLAQNTPEDLETKWPPVNDREHILSVDFNFPVECPDGFYEMCAVSLQKYLGLFAQQKIDWKDGVLASKAALKILLKRQCLGSDWVISFAVRGSDPKHLWNLFIPIYEKMKELLKRWPGVFYDAFYICPHCLRNRFDNPTMFPANVILMPSMVEDFIPCDNAENGMIPVEMALPTANMDTCERVRLRKNWKNFLQDIDVDLILPSMISKGLVTSTKNEEILKPATTQKKNEIFMLHVLSLNSVDYASFLDILQDNHWWLRECLKDTKITPADIAKFSDAEKRRQILSKLTTAEQN